MNIEVYEDDFSPIQETEAEEQTQSSEEAHKKPEKKRKNKKEVPTTEIVPGEVDNTKKRSILSKILVFLGIILVVAAFIAVFLTNDFFKKYRDNFVVNVQYIDSKLGISERFSGLFEKTETDFLKIRDENKAMGTTYDNKTYLIPFESASESKIAVVDEGVIVAKSNYIACMNDKGEEVWALTTSVNNPILCVEGKYIAIAENGGTKVCLYNGNKLIYAADAQNQILNASLSSQGDIVVVTEKEFFKGAVEAFNNKGERFFSWTSGTDTVMCADISPSSRRIAVGFLNSKDSIVGSVQLFSVDDEQSYKTIEIPGTVVFSVEFTGETLNVFGDNRLIELTVHGDVINDETIDGELSAYSIDADGNKVMVINQNNLPIINIYSKKGDLSRTINVDELPDYVDIMGKQVIYNNTRMILFGKNNRFKKYAAAMDVKGVKIVNSKTYIIIYSNSLEFVKA